jgi:hypothetical protein
MAAPVAVTGARLSQLEARLDAIESTLRELILELQRQGR